MDCGRCPRCIVGSHCINPQQLTTSNDKRNTATDECKKCNDILDADKSHSVLVPVPPPSRDPVILRTHHHSCQTCSSSFTRLDYLREHKERMKREKRELGFSDEQICFVWHHLYLGWNECREHFIQQFPLRKNLRTVRRNFDHSLHRKGYRIQDQSLYVPQPRYSAFDPSQYTWLAVYPSTSKKRTYECRYCDEAFETPVQQEVHETRHARRCAYTKEERWFLWYYYVDLKMDWDECFKAHQKIFGHKRKQHGAFITMWRFIKSKVPTSTSSRVRSSIPSVFTFCKIRYSWMDPPQ